MGTIHARKTSPHPTHLLANKLNRKAIEAPGAKKDCGFYGDE
jgi:hypothetical protein